MFLGIFLFRPIDLHNLASEGLAPKVSKAACLAVPRFSRVLWRALLGWAFSFRIPRYISACVAVAARAPFFERM